MKKKNLKTTPLILLFLLLFFIGLYAAVSQLLTVNRQKGTETRTANGRPGWIMGRLRTKGLISYPKHKDDPNIFYKYLKNLKKCPKVGLVLSGGGAKGLAHVGVLKIIEDSGLKIDYLTGTSMGSIVGGLYATGYTAPMLENLVVRGLDWDDLLSDEVDRRSIAIDEKEGHDKYIDYASLPITKEGIQLPTGIKKGQKLTSMLSRLTLHVQHIDDFNDFPIPFRCIATDIEKGDPIVLRRGYLPDALRASMAIPSVFTPIEINGCLLVDGGVVRNLPVKDAVDMGADLIIAVDVGAPLYKKGELKSFINIIDQSISFLGVQSTKAEQQNADILISPNISNFSSSEFKRGKELIETGMRAGRRVQSMIREIAKIQDKFSAGSEESFFRRFMANMAHNPKDRIKNVRITEIEIRGLEHVSENLIRGKLRINPPTELTPDELAEAADRVYASGFFERVTYQIKPSKNGLSGNDRRLILNVVETSGIYLKLGFSYDTDLNAAVLANVTIRNLAGQGSKISIDARLSELPGVLLSYFIHSGIRRPGIGFGVKLHYDRFNISTYKLGDIQSVYDYHNTGADLLVQAVIFNYVAMGVGVQKDLTFIRTQVSPSDPRSDDNEATNYYAYGMFDNLDATLYPTSGLQLYGEVKYITHHLAMYSNNKYPNFYKYTGKIKAYIPLVPRWVSTRRISLFIGLTGGFILAHEPYYLSYDILTGLQVYRNTIPVTYTNYMGGLFAYNKICFPFTGINFMQINSKQMLVGDIGLQVEFLKDVFFILRGSVGRVKNRFEDLFRYKNRIIEQIYDIYIPKYQHLKNDLIYGYGFTLSYDSVIGPVEATLMRGSQSNKFMFHFNIGYRI